MKVLSYEPDGGRFFVAVTWDEYRQLAAKYEIDTGNPDVGVEEAIEVFRYHHEVKDDAEEEAERASYEQYIKELYGIDNLPDICLIVKRDLSDLAVEQYDYPFHHMWNGYSPWEKIEAVSIDDLDSLAALECASGAAGDDTIETLLKSSIGHMLKGGAGDNLLWSRKELTAQKLGAFCEYYAKMTLLSYGVSIYTSEVDDHGIDFAAEGRNGFLKFQVKGIRASSQYVFMRKEYFDIEDDAMFLFLLLLADGEHPDMYLIPASAWRQESRAFVSHDYEGKKSKPEYGVNISKKNMPELEKYRLEHMLPLFW